MSETSTEDRAATGELEFVREFVNTRELDPDREEIGNVAGLAGWLESQGIAVDEPLDEDDVQRATAFREAVRALLLANAGEELDPAAIATLREAGDGARLRTEVTDDGTMATVPACTGVDSLIARVLAAIGAAQESGEWHRLKACTSDECLWAFYDRSRNRSRHWCSMNVCGNRAKTRAYRAKQRGG